MQPSTNLKFAGFQPSTGPLTSWVSLTNSQHQDLAGNPYNFLLPTLSETLEKHSKVQSPTLRTDQWLMKDANQQIKTQHLRQTHSKKDETSASVRKYMIPPQFQSQTLLQLTRHRFMRRSTLKVQDDCVTSLYRSSNSGCSTFQPRAPSQGIVKLNNKGPIQKIFLDYLPCITQKCFPLKV